MRVVNFTPWPLQHWEKPLVPTAFTSSSRIHLNSKDRTGKLSCKALTGIATPKKKK